eukprot:COSAG05_NODE_2240_length_3353_cov_16.749232_1_plen_100_part_00
MCASSDLKLHSLQYVPCQTQSCPTDGVYVPCQTQSCQTDGVYHPCQTQSCQTPRYRECQIVLQIDNSSGHGAGADEALLKPKKPRTGPFFDPVSGDQLS